jgi:hypothetical protein
MNRNAIAETLGTTISILLDALYAYVMCGIGISMACAAFDIDLTASEPRTRAIVLLCMIVCLFSALVRYAVGWIEKRHIARKTQPGDSHP